MTTPAAEPNPITAGYEVGDIVRTGTSKDRVVVAIADDAHFDRLKRLRCQYHQWTPDEWAAENNRIETMRKYMREHGPEVATRALRNGKPFGPTITHHSDALTPVSRPN